MLSDKLGEEGWTELNSILNKSRRIVDIKFDLIDGMKLSELCPLAEMLILDDPYLNEQNLLDSGPSSFGGELRDDAFYRKNKFERQFNTLYEMVWMLLYRSISDITGTGPYVVQIPNFEIRKSNGIRTVHNIGSYGLTKGGDVTRSGSILLLWLAEVGELCANGYRYLHYLIDDHPEIFDKIWQEDWM